MSELSCRTCEYSYGANGELRCSASYCWVDRSKYFPKLDACLRTLAWMIECDTCAMKCNTDDEPNPDCITKLIDYAKNNPTEEAGE